MKRVLVAEDDAPTRSFLVAALTDEGYLVSVATDGQDALERCAEVKPDIVVLDLSMPIVDGFEFLRRRGAERLDLARAQRIECFATDGENDDEKERAVLSEVYANTSPQLVSATPKLGGTLFASSPSSS